MTPITDEQLWGTPRPAPKLPPGMTDADTSYPDDAPDPRWTEGADGFVRAPLDWRGTL